MKKYLTPVCALLFCANAFAQDNNLIVRTSAGDQALALASVESITFPATGGIVYTANGSSTTVDEAQFVSIRFDGTYSAFATYTAVDDVQAESENLNLAGSVISANGKITVYTIDGRIARVANNELNISTLAPGIYIAKSSYQSLKFSVR